MCLSVPGKITAIASGKATVTYASETREAAILDESEFQIGDYVIVQGKIVVQKIPEKEAMQFYELISNNEI